MPLHVNIAGTWKSGTPYVNVAGAWKLASSVWVNVAGTWKKAWEGMGTWTTKASMPTARAALAAAAPGNGKLYAIGGSPTLSFNPVLATNEEYDPTTDTWTTKASMPTARAALAAAAPGNGKLYAIGGVTAFLGSGLTTNQEYNPSTNTWTSKAAMPTGREDPAAAAPGNGKLYAIGGATVVKLIMTYYNVNQEYNPSTNTWTSKAAMPTARAGLAAAAPGNGKLYALGGYDGSSWLATNEEYDPTTNTWTTKANMPGGRSGGSFAAAPGNGKIYCVGVPTYEYNPSVNTWATKADAPEATAAVAAPGNGKLYAMGGYDIVTSTASNINLEYTPPG